MGAKLGQHFLIDKSVIAEIIDAADLSPRDTVLEIGPGKGVLTRALINTGAKVIAVEKDGDLHHKLKKTFREATNLKLIHTDIRNFDLSSLPRRYKVVANIPYYLTGQLIPMFLQADNPPSLMVLMVQKEVAERLLAPKGSSSLLQLGTLVFSQIKKIAYVARIKFSPPPEVDSAIVKFVLRPQPLLPLDEHKIFFRLLKFAFAGKRKMITNTLSAAFKISKNNVLQALSDCNLNDKARPQELDINEWICLYKKLLLQKRM